MKKGEMLSRMIVIATNAHAGQFDKAGKLYILHTIQVMLFVDDNDEELQCIAVGHDLFEDTDITPEFLREHGMTERVINGIQCMTKWPGQTYEEYQAVVFGNRDAMKGKKADLRHNRDIRRLQCVTEKDLARLAKYIQFSAEIQAKLDEIE